MSGRQWRFTVRRSVDGTWSWELQRDLVPGVLVQPGFKTVDEAIADVDGIRKASALVLPSVGNRSSKFDHNRSL